MIDLLVEVEFRLVRLFDGSVFPYVLLAEHYACRTYSCLCISIFRIVVIVAVFSVIAK